MDVLQRIQRLVRDGYYQFTFKALDEMAADGLYPNDVLEAIHNARWITKVLHSANPSRPRARERLYVIESFNNAGSLLYTKGKIVRELQAEVFYILVSAKVSTRSS
jgi:hypothetical protein